MKLTPGTAQHLGGQESQQDAFGFSDPEDAALIEHGGMVAVVADGSGNDALGQAVSSAATGSFLEAYAGKARQESIPEALERSLHAANESVLGKARNAGGVGEIGSTLVAAALHQDRFFFISVGDCAAYHLRSGRLFRLTVAHTRGADLDRQVLDGQRSAEAATRDPDRADLTSFLGRQRLSRFDRNFRPLALTTGDRILICTDGVSEALEDRQIEACLKDAPRAAAQRLVRAAVNKSPPEPDNATAIVIASGRAERWGSW